MISENNITHSVGKQWDERRESSCSEQDMHLANTCMVQVKGRVRGKG